MNDGQNLDNPITDPTTDYPLLQLLRQYARPHVPYLIAGVIAQVAKRIPIHAPVFVIGIAYDAIFNDKSYTLPLFPSEMIPTTDVGQLWFTVVVLSGLAIWTALGRLSEEWVWNVFSERTKHDIRVDAYNEIQRLSLEFFDNNQTGEIMSVLSNDVDALGSFLTNGIRQTLQTLGFIAGAGLFMILLDWQLALVALTIGPVLTFANYRFATIVERLHKNIRSSVGSLNSRLENNITGISVIKAYATEPFESSRVEDASGANYEARWNTHFRGVTQYALMTVLSGWGLAATFVLGGYWVINGPPLVFTGEMTAGTLIPFMFYTQNLIHPLRQISKIIDSYKQGKAAATRIVGIKETDRRVTNPDEPRRFDDIKGRVKYDAVSFQYDTDGPPTIQNVDISVDPGEVVGLVGPTGAGKSTLMKLLLRFYDVDEGTIRVDDVDIRTVDRTSLRRQVGYVSQEPFLFHGTVRENVTYGYDDVDEETIISATTQAGAHEFIESLQDGYDTVIGERGVKLSGGQRQRIAIARAIVQDPPILILDEATSHVDNETEVLIQNALAELIEDRTTFVIAHQLSTVRRTDRIIVVDDGEIAERNTHDKLLENDGLYADLWEVQVGQVGSSVTATIEQSEN